MHVDRQHDSTPFSFVRSRYSGDPGIWSSWSRPADLVPLGLEEGEDHAAADQDAVGLVEQVVDHAELVGYLGAVEHDRVGGALLGELLQDADLGGDQAPAACGRRAGRS